ncbi:MAG: hypothetical protein COA67_12530 [Lutibacter sp.]|nr:MAG: hypothetical protein COA67_12530 [Lutibacter sp.]
MKEIKLFIILLCGLFLTVSCDNDPLTTKATITTSTATNATFTTIDSGGNVTSNGGTAVTTRGLCWSTTPNPTVTDNTKVATIDNFTTTVTGLSENTTYYIRAFAVNSDGVSYGNEEMFTTWKLGNTQWAFLLNYDPSNSNYPADVDFYSDGTTKWEEPTYPGVYTTKTKILSFSNLAPNLYELEVKTTDQHFNQTTVKQYLNVIPAWWETTLAKIGFGFLSLFGFWLLIRIIKKQVRKNEEAKVQQDMRIAGLELQALRSQMNPHFVHNSLNAIQYFIQRNEVELSENYLSKFSQLIRLFFEYSRRQNITIKEELELLVKYLDIEKLRFEEKLNYTISVDEKIDDEDQIIPSMILQPIVENAVNHGLFHKKTNGIIHVNFIYISDTSFQVVVKDDGIGILEAKKLHATSSKNYQSNSSAVLHERLDLLKQSKEWKISYGIKDISEIETNNTGTIVTLIFKQL